MMNPSTTIDAEEGKPRLRLAGILSGLHEERAHLQQRLAALEHAISCLEVLNNGGRRPRGRPRGLSKSRASFLQPVQHIS